jgi:hypothetical protein
MAREAARRSASSNNLRQIGHALHNCNDQIGYMPPLFGAYPYVKNWNQVQNGSDGPAWGPLPYLILPWIEQKSIHDQSYIAYGSGRYPNWSSGNPAAYSYVLKIYINPSDPSISAGGDYQGIAHSGYAANGQVFGRVNSSGSLLDYAMDAQGNGGPSIGRTITDGTTNTILFAEKYGRCNLSRAPANDWNGTFWNYGWATDPTWHLGAPFFACDYAGRYPNAIGPGSRFQAFPIPDSPQCDPARAQAPRAGGILVVMADASTRIVSSNVDPNVWWWACTPDRNEAMPGDW